MLKSTLALKKSDDLFEKSSMSFGDHLEELRRALIRVAMCMMAGLCVGIPMATTVVSYMQTPLEAALDEFYRNQSMAEMEATNEQAVSPQLSDWMKNNKKRSEVVFVDIQRWKHLTSDAADTPAISPPTTPASSTEAESEQSRATEEPKGTSVPVDAADTETESKSAIESTNIANADDSKPTDSDAPKPQLEATDKSEPGLKKNSSLYIADSAGLPTPERLVPLRIFSSIKSQAETFSMQEGMMIWFKAALVVAAIVASPGIFYYIWGFVASGLYPHERRYVYFFLPASVGLFWLGALFAFLVVFRLVISFLLNFNAMMGVGTSPRLNDYMSFALLLPLGFGVSFQLPLVMLIIERLGILTVETYIKQWRMAIFVIAVVSMLLTPADVSSMISMAVPLVFLYFLGIALCKFLPRAGMLGGAAADPR